MKLELVSHCWNYARLLTYQLSSIVLHPPAANDLRVVVYHAERDERTVETLTYFAAINVKRVTWDFRTLAPSRLCRRSIGRNEAALATDADWVWFADCDMPIHCWDELASCVQCTVAPLVFPKHVSLSRNHEVGDRLIELVKEPSIYDFEKAFFSRRRFRRAIGGIQIARGDLLRDRGYLNGSKRAQTPVKHWRRTYEDMTFRKSFGTKGHAINLDGVYRIRHSKRGRDHKGVEL